MPLLEYSGGKVFTSTGVSPWQDAYTARSHTFLVETNAGSTCSFQLQHRMKNGTFAYVLSSGTIDASSGVAAIYAGSYYQTRVRIKTLTATSTTTARWFGN